MDKGKTRALPLAAAVLAVLLIRVPFLRVNPLALLAIRMALAASMCAACRPQGWFWPLAQAVGLAALAWLIDLNEGAMAFVYGGAGLAMAWAFKRGRRLRPLPSALLMALCTCLAAALGTALVMALGRAQMTPGGALLYALRRQAAPLIAYAAGGFIALRLGWGPAAA